MQFITVYWNAVVNWLLQDSKNGIQSVGHQFGTVVTFRNVLGFVPFLKSLNKSSAHGQSL